MTQTSRVSQVAVPVFTCLLKFSPCQIKDTSCNRNFLFNIAEKMLPTILTRERCDITAVPSHHNCISFSLAVCTVFRACVFDKLLTFLRLVFCQISSGRVRERWEVMEVDRPNPWELWLSTYHRHQEISSLKRLNH